MPVIRRIIPLLLAGVLALAASGTAAQEPPLLVVLAPTGVTRDGLPVLTRHPAPQPWASALEAGYSGRLLRLYRWHQQARARRQGTPVEPAYLLLSEEQGGFPRFGFWLDSVRKDDVAYVDLHRNGDISGRFGAMDQIFPHELLHVIVHQSAGEPPAGGANQVHAIGVRTDRFVAWNEGFAEHAQVMAADDPDGLPETRALAADTAQRRRVLDQFSGYRRALASRLSIAPRARVGFLLWFSSAEQVLRYHGVKANLFAHETPVPARLLAARDPYRAYLVENVVPGDTAAPRKSAARALATEGVVSALFSRWMQEPALDAPGPAAIYAASGIAPGEARPGDHAYLKLFWVLREARPQDAAGVITAYRAAFPADTPAVDAIVRDVVGQGCCALPPEIWLASPTFRTGTTLFDQRRAVPRVHTFDLNAASSVDLVTIPGVDTALARALAAHAPYADLADVRRVPGASEALAGTLEGMALEAVRMKADTAEAEAGLTLSSILLPYLWWALFVLAAAAVAGAAGYRAVRRVRWWRAGLNGAGAAFLVLGAGWIVGGPAPLVAILVLGLPATAIALIRRRADRPAWRVAAAWVAAALPAVVAIL